MALQSMTGFARSQGGENGSRWVWEIRSVNGKGLDIRFRLPAGFEGIEQQLRDVAQSSIVRGNLQATLQIDDASRASLPRLNEPALEAVLVIAGRIAERTGMAPPGVAELMAVKGVVEIAEGEAGEEERKRREEQIIAGFAQACAALVTMREKEGAKVAAVLAGQVDAIAGLAARVSADPSRTPEAIRERIANQVELLAGSASGLDRDRLHQEAVILATRADLREEIDRLEAHIAAAHDLLASGEAVGRKLDFLAQEFNRECNTICSKSNAVSVTAAGLEMKAVIDQFREQVQNLQ